MTKSVPNYRKSNILALVERFSDHSFEGEVNDRMQEFWNHLHCSAEREHRQGILAGVFDKDWVSTCTKSSAMRLKYFEAEKVSPTNFSPAEQSIGSLADNLHHSRIYLHRAPNVRSW